MTSVTLVRQIKAKASTVFDLISTPEGLTSWWGPADLPVLSADADVRTGGHYRVRFRTNDGLEHECAGEFLAVEPPSRIVMSWRWTDGGEPDERDEVSQVEMHVRPTQTGAELMLIHANLQSAASEASHRQGWANALDKLDVLIESQAPRAAAPPASPRAPAAWP